MPELYRRGILPGMVKLAPSLLAADFTRLGHEIDAAETGGADWIHVDVMDGRFVPNITIGPLIVEACRRATGLPLDVHLMIVEPERYIDAFRSAGADRITVHAETSSHLHRALQQIRDAGANPGLAVNPLTPLAIVRDALPYCDTVLVMTVNPGFGGQAFIDASVDRVEQVRIWRDDIRPECLIEVDGGITVDTAPTIVAAGADVLVAGSAVFGSGDVESNLAALRQAADGAPSTS